MIKKDIKITEAGLNILSSVIEGFCVEYVKEIREIIKNIEEVNSEKISEKLPKPLNNINNSLLIRATYSIDQNLIFIDFSEIKGSESKYFFNSIEGSPLGNIIGFDDPANYMGLMKIANCTFENIKVEYGFLASIKGLTDKMLNVKEFAGDFVNCYIDVDKYKKVDEKNSYLDYLHEVKEEFLKLISDENTPELVIDKFLENHPIILQRGLHLENLKHQVVMKNILGKYEHDLKPDLIAFDVLIKKWVIVDYKKAKRDMIKNVGRVRTGFKSYVIDLQNQLLDYKEYFEEKEQRDYITKKYKCNIVFPNTIGIIGDIKEEEEFDFNRLERELPRWYSVMPYNYLYESYCRYIGVVDEIMKK